MCLLFQDLINGVVEVSSSEWDVVGAYTWTIFSWYLSVMRRTSSATLELPEDTLVMLSFHFLFMRKPTPACPLLASEWYSRWPLWRVVKLSSFLRTSPSPIASHFMLFSFSSSSSSCTCSSFSNVLTSYVAIFNRSPLVLWFFLTQRLLAPPACSLGGHEPPPRSQTSMLLGTGGLGLFVLCMLVFMAYHSTLANAGWKEVPKFEYQAYVVVFQH